MGELSFRTQLTRELNKTLFFQIKYKGNFLKEKEMAVGLNMSDSKTLHSLQVGKMSSDVSRSSAITGNKKRNTTASFFNSHH